MTDLLFATAFLVIGGAFGAAVTVALPFIGCALAKANEVNHRI